MKKICKLVFSLVFFGLSVFGASASADTLYDTSGNPVQEYNLYNIKINSTNHTVWMSYRQGAWVSTYLTGFPEKEHAKIETLFASSDASVGAEVTTDKNYRLGTRVTNDSGFEMMFPFYEKPSVSDLWGGLYLKATTDYSCNFTFKNAGNNQYAVTTDDGPIYYQPTSGYIVPILVPQGWEISEPFTLQFEKL